MPWTAEERKIYKDIVHWKKSFAPATCIKGEVTERQNQDEEYPLLDAAMYMLQTIAYSPRWQKKAGRKVLDVAKTMDGTIEAIDDIAQLSIEQIIAVAEHLTKEQSYRALVQGGLTGLGHLLLLSCDLLRTVIDQMRLVQLIAMAHGYGIRQPTEMLISLKVLRIATVPRRERYATWQATEHAILQLTHPYFYEEDDRFVQKDWLLGQIKHVAKMVLLRFLRKKTVFGLPIISIAFGSGMNYISLRTIAMVAQKFYTKRLLLERER